MAELSQYAGRIPTWCAPDRDRILALAEARLLEVTSTWPRHDIDDLAAVGGPVITLDTPGDQTEALQDAIQWSSDNETVILWGIGGAPGGYIHLGEETPITTENFAINPPSGLFTTVEDSALITINRALPVGIVVDDQVVITSAGMGLVADINMENYMARIVSINPGVSYVIRSQKNADQSGTTSGGGTAMELEFRKGFVSLDKQPGAAFYCGPTAKLWLKGGESSIFDGNNGDDFAWVGGNIGFFTDDYGPRNNAQVDRSDGERMLYSGITFDGIYGITFLCSGDDFYIGDCTVDNIPLDGGGCFRHQGTFLIENCPTVVSSDDNCMSGPNSDTGDNTAIYSKVRALPWQGAMFAQLVNGDPDLVNYVGPGGDNTAMWPLTSRFLGFECSGRPGNNKQLDRSGPAVKCTNLGFQMTEMVLVKTVFDKSKLAVETLPTPGSPGIWFRPGRGPIELTGIDCHFRGHADCAIKSQGMSTGDAFWTSLGTKVRFHNTVFEAPLIAGRDTISIWGADIIELDGCTVYLNGGHGLAVGVDTTGATLTGKASMAGGGLSTPLVTLNATRFIGIANGKAGVRVGSSVDAVEERHCSFEPAAGATTAKAVSRASLATDRVSGINWPFYNAYNGTTVTHTG